MVESFFIIENLMYVIDLKISLIIQRFFIPSDLKIAKTK